MTPDLWSPTQSPQTMPDGPGESFEAYRAKLGKKGECPHGCSHVYPDICFDPDCPRGLDGLE